MRGLEKENSNTGCPWPGGLEIMFEQPERGFDPRVRRFNGSVF